MSDPTTATLIERGQSALQWQNIPAINDLSGKLAERAKVLEGRMEKGEAWLTANPRHRAYTQHEDTWIELLKEYVAAMDCLDRLVAHRNQEVLW